MKIHQQQLNLLPAPSEPVNFQLRDYQKQVVSDLYRFFRKGFTTGLVYGSTGCGKTAIACKIIALLNRYQEILDTDGSEYRGKMKLLNFALDEAKQYVKR